MSGMPQPKSKMDKREQELRIGRGQAELEGIPDDRAEQSLRMKGMQQQQELSPMLAFKARQDAMAAYNKRQGMGSKEEMDQLRRRAK